MQFGILGPLEVLDHGGPIPLAGDRQRALLALLLLNANQAVSTERLIDELWGGRPPESAAKTLQVHISRLRKALDQPPRGNGDSGVVVTREHGYELRVDRECVDSLRFEQLVAEARGELASRRAGRAASLLGEALSLWRGPPLAEFAYERFAELEIPRLEELRACALEELIEAKLALGRHAELVGELERLVGEYPYRERLRAQLMLALYRSERQAEALQAYQEARRALVEELGIEPGERLRELERAVLAQDQALAYVGEQEAPGRSVVDASRAALVGRERELSELTAALEDARAGRGRLVLLAGEPGIGKSRLADELVWHAERRGARVLIGRCWEAGGAPVYWPWVQALRACMGAANRDVLRRQLGSGAADIAHILPELRDLFPGLPDPASSDPEGARFRLFDAITAFLHVSAEDRPLVLVIDDLHAADTPSLLLLRFAARELADSRILIIAAYRDTEIGPDHALSHTLAELVRERATRRTELHGLAVREAADFIERSGCVQPPAGLVEAIHTQTEGNPLFIGEIVRLLRSHGAPEALPGSERAIARIPSGIREVIAHRLRDLSLECKRVLGVASVMGREFRIEPLRRVTTHPGDDLLELLDEAVRARALQEIPGSPGRLRFAHALIRDVLYKELSAIRRIQLHQVVGEALESLYGDREPHLAELAYHFYEGAPAGDAGKAIEYAQRAAERASAQLAYEEAVRLYRLSLSALDQDTNDARRCELLLGLGEAQTSAGEVPQYKEPFLEAAGIAERIGEAGQLAAAALGYGGRFVWARAAGDPHLIPLLQCAVAAVGEQDSTLRARLLARLSGALRDQPDRDRRTRLAREAVEIARRLNDTATVTWALDASHIVIWGPDTQQERIHIATEMLEVAERNGKLEAELLAHDYRVYAFLELGDLDAVHAERDAAARAAAELKQPAYWWKVAAIDAMLALFDGRFDEAATLIERALQVGGSAHSYAAVAHALQTFALRSARGPLNEAAEPLTRLAAEYPTYPVLTCALAALHAESGDRPKARALFEHVASDNFGSVNRDEEWLLAMTLLAPVCAYLQDTEQGTLLYELLVPFAGLNGFGAVEFATGSVSRSLGRLAALTGRWDDSIRHFEAAIEMNERMGARPWHAHAQHDYARALLARGHPRDEEQALELLAVAADNYRELGMQVWAERADSDRLQRSA